MKYKVEVEIKKGETKTMNKVMKQYLGTLTVGLLVFGFTHLKTDNVWGHGATNISSTAIVDVMVTPIVTVSLAASPTYYNFQTLALNSSSISATAIVLTNDGNVGVTMQKHGSDSSPWTIDTTTGSNRFTLYAATASARPSLGALETAGNRLATTLSNLQGNGGGAQVTMNPTENVNLWFEIHMPTATTTAAQRTIPVHFQGTSQ